MILKTNHLYFSKRKKDCFLIDESTDIQLYGLTNCNVVTPNVVMRDEVAVFHEEISPDLC